MDASDDEDEQVKLAIAMSLQESPNSTVATGPQQNQYAYSEALPKEITEKSVMTATSNSKPDLKQMHLERLARDEARKVETMRGKRQRSISPPPIKRHTPAPSDRELKRPKTNSVPEVIDLDADTRDPSLRKRSLTIPPTTLSSVSSEARKSALEYPLGVTKRTWAFGHDRSNDIKIQEVLQKNTLTFAVLSAFDWDIEWLLRKFEFPRTKLILVMQAKGKAAQDQHRKDAEDLTNLELCFPDMSGQINCMHSKLMLLFHPTHLRVVVPTANLNSYDWGETGIMENSVFLVDLPRRSGKDADAELTPFAKELFHFVRAKGLPEKVLKGLKNFDYSRTNHLAFVHTIGGSHHGEDLKRTGIPGLSRAVRSLNLETDNLEVDFTASSIGSLNDAFLKNVYFGAKGEAPAQIIARDVPKAFRDKFRIYFPLHETVLKTIGGIDNAGTNCLQASYYSNSRFPKECMHDYKSIRTGLLSHNKILFARGQRVSRDGHATNVAWAYVGSANVSESAWGKLLMDKSKKAEKLNCRNWECGVLIAIPPAKLNTCKTLEGLVPMDVFAGHVDVPFEYPGEKYGAKKPWFFMERH
ncbi:phospholipase D/nuclease [Mytilinidion resinicola]|uniref:Phospholipase D/nuclease n=1 Tax=Mytilinidion resinicola TaxID=574789 RepID=A0A6A6Z7W6_9PEZI|nr:phospholipase D/nuclease [Mytilinidion resinicola]KAF2817202.1 phospholipase D/nuclease [Mytilinidion resinicola]